MALCLIVLVTAGCGGVDEQTAMEQASKNIEGHDYGAAIIELKKVLQKNASNATARFLLGTAYLQLDDAAKAERAMKKALETGIPPEQVLIPLGEALLLQGRFEDLLSDLSPDKGRAHGLEAQVLGLRGTAQLGLGEVDAAEESFLSALKRQPDLVSALEGLSQIEAGRGNIDLATARLKDALALAPDDSDLWMLKGDIALSQEDNNAALAAFDKALDLAVTNRRVGNEFDARLRHAQVLQKMGNADAAQKEVDEILERAPDLSMAHYVNALIAYSTAKYDRAELELRKTLRLSPDHAPSLFLLGATQYAKAEYAQAADPLTRYLAKHPSDSRARTMLGTIQLRLNRPAEALKILSPVETRAVQENKQSLQLALRGTSELVLGDTSAAEESFQAALKLEPVSVPALEGQLRIEAARGNIDAAKAQVTKALTLAPDHADLWLLKATIALSEKDNTAALAAYEKARDLAVAAGQEEKSLRAQLGRAQVLQISGNTEAAKKELDTVLKRAPELPLAHYLNADIAYAAKNYDRAETELQETLRLAPGHSPSLFLLGATESLKGNYSWAVDLLADYLAVRPTDVRARKLLAAARLNLGDPKKALAALEPIQSQADQDAGLSLLLGQAAMHSQQPDLALRYFGNAETLRPNDASVLFGMAQANVQRGDYDAATKELKGKKDRRSQSLLIQAQVQKGDFAAARATVREMQEQSPDSPALRLLAGSVEVAAGDREAGERLFLEAIDLDADYLPPMLALGRMKLQAGKLHESELWFRKAIDDNPDNLDALMGLAGVATARGDTDKALAEVELAHKANENALPPRLWLARYYLSRGNTDQAVQILEKALGPHPNQQILALLAQAYKQSGSSEEALLIYQQMLAKAPESEPLMLRIAALESELGRQNAARRGLKKALTLDPQSSPARAALAVVENRAGNPKRGLKLAAEIQQREPESPLGYAVAGDIQMDQKDYASAVASYRAASKREPSQALVIKQHKALVLSGDDPSAEGILTQWLEENPQDVTVRLLLATSYQESGRNADAIPEYEEILEQHPEQAVALNNLALLIFPQDKKKGLDYARRAAKLAPDNPAINDTYGWLLVEDGHPAEGIKHLEQAAEAVDHPSVRYHLGAAMAAIGSAEAAWHELESALASTQSFDEREAARDLLDELRESRQLTPTHD